MRRFDSDPRLQPFLQFLADSVLGAPHDFAAILCRVDPPAPVANLSLLKTLPAANI
jgi:hypothetical protein